MQPQIMYIESKADGLSWPARIGRVSFSKSGSSIYYNGLRLRTLSGDGFKSNYYDVQSGDEYWVSGCKKDGSDRLYGGVVSIDDDVREEYWTRIRKMPGKISQRTFRSAAKYKK